MQNYILTNPIKGVRIHGVNSLQNNKMQYISEYQEDIMDLLSREKTGKVERPVRVLQFGEEISFVLLWII